MRKSITLITCIILCFQAARAQYVTIPDPYFKQFLTDNYPGCMNASGMLDTTCTAVLTAKRLFLGTPSGIIHPYWITDFTGLEYFKNLEFLDLSPTDLSSGNIIFPASLDSLKTVNCYVPNSLNLPNSLKYWNSDYCGIISRQPLPDSLIYLSCYSGQLDTLLTLPPALEYLNVSNDYQGYIKHMPTLPVTLTYLNCSNNLLNSLPALPPALTYLNCSGNGNFINNEYFTNLPALPPLLDTLDCSNMLSQMPALPASITFLRFSGGTLASLPALPPGLKTLRIEGAQALTSIPALPGTITYMSCYNTAISPLPTLPAALKTFIFELDTMLTAMPAIPAGVEYISCFGNRLAAFPAIPAGLTYLDCSNNRITSLPSLPAGLLHLNAGNNRLTTLPAMPSSLNMLWINNNQLISFPDISNTSVYHFDCGYNNLTSITALPATLNGLLCNNNQLTSLPVLPPGLDTLVCNDNSITSLPASNAGILMCHNNQLSELPELNGNNYGITCYGNNIYCLPRLPQTGCPLQIILDTAKVKCIPNTIVNGIVQDYHQGMGLDACGTGLYHWVDLPICNATNNIAGCHPYPVISGTAFYDINSNGIKDNNELYKQNLDVHLQNGEYTFTDGNGHFDIAAVGAGNNTITIGTVRFYNVVPPSSLYNFTSYDTTVTKDYALKPAVTKDSVSIAIIPLYWAARPGFTYTYRVLYENIGTTILNHNLQLNFDSSKLVFDSASNPLAVNTGNSITLATNNFVPGQRGMLDVYFSVKTTVPLNSPLFAKAVISAGSNSWTDSTYSEISGAYDPNDKHGTPQLSPLQVTNGEYIKYTIRFQNTGTDTAFNIVISDVLNSDLQAGTLQMIGSSHNCKATVKGNTVFFEFLNILLPDSNINEAKSHGFVSFRIKPKTTVAVNTTIPNNAAIYFDYNTPVITNTTGTLIKEFTVVPLKLVSFSAVPQNDNTTSLYWNTANEINTKLFVIEQSSNGTSFNPAGKLNAKGSANNNYSFNAADINNSLVYYRLKIVDNDGRFTYSPVLKVDRRKNTSGVSVMTNPVKDFMIISTNDGRLNNTQCTVINTQGMIVKIFIIKLGSQAIDIRDFPAGVYYLRTVAGTNKILIQ